MRGQEQVTLIGSHHGQTTRDEGLVLHRIEACVEAQHVIELLGTPTHGVDEVVAGVLDELTLMGTHQSDIVSAHLLHMEQLAVLEVTTALLHTDPTDVVDDAARRGLPAVAGDKGMAVGVLAVVPQRRNLLLEVLALNHVGVAPSA